ncbi:hypothetical protein RFI_31897 [Reticulomyxa filosa]|uniref:Uncharacterized protein n=1 Tax=Reticulomyxa filosa TaxID=46433 RepID=X6LXP2_RETFI|nr:hypothetical protein RFI_31897 [Reticulomyxa filosa]|eukprot:ETO05500.1 hypothetical protein RFI_31897 [Reticulomyxa filosa]
MLDTFRLSSKLINALDGHTHCVHSIDYAIFDGSQLLCSGSNDKTVRVWDVGNNKQVQLFEWYSSSVNCVKFSQYHYYKYHRNVVCSTSYDETILFFDIKDKQLLQIFDEHADGICSIEFSPFNGGRYLCTGSWNKKINLWDVETSKSLYIFKGHTMTVKCVDFSPHQSNINNNQSNIIGVIGGNGYTICSGSQDKTIRIWDIETAEQLNVFKGHKQEVISIKYGLNGLGNIGGANTILSGSVDESVRLWDIRSGQQIQVFNGHTNYVNTVEYSPFVVDNIEVGCNSNVICSGSLDNTIRFWDIRSNKKELYVIKGGNEDNDGITCFKFLQLKNDSKTNNSNGCEINLCYGSWKGPICIWG